MVGAQKKEPLQRCNMCRLRGAGSGSPPGRTSRGRRPGLFWCWGALFALSKESCGAPQPQLEGPALLWPTATASRKRTFQTGKRLSLPEGPGRKLVSNGVGRGPPPPGAASVMLGCLPARGQLRAPSRWRIPAHDMAACRAPCAHRRGAGGLAASTLPSVLWHPRMRPRHDWTVSAAGALAGGGGGGEAPVCAGSDAGTGPRGPPLLPPPNAPLPAVLPRQGVRHPPTFSPTPGRHAGRVWDSTHPPAEPFSATARARQAGRGRTPRRHPGRSHRQGLPGRLRGGRGRRRRRTATAADINAGAHAYRV